MYSSIKPCVLAFGLLSAAVSAHADNVSVGLGTGIGFGPYKSMDKNMRVLPNIHYEGDKFFIRGLSGGFHLNKTQDQEFNIIVNYSPWKFNPNDSDDRQLQRLDKRKSTVMAGVGYVLRGNWGSVNASFTADVLNNSNGFLGDIAYKYPMTVQRFKVTPEIGALWASKKHNDYYYGISAQESARSGLNTYTAKSAFLPYVGLSASYPITSNLHLSVTSKYIQLPNTIKDSPMVNKSGIAIIGAGVGYQF